MRRSPSSGLVDDPGCVWGGGGRRCRWGQGGVPWRYRDHGGQYPGYPLWQNRMLAVLLGDKSGREENTHKYSK